MHPNPAIHCIRTKKHQRSIAKHKKQRIAAQSSQKGRSSNELRPRAAKRTDKNQRITAQSRQNIRKTNELRPRAPKTFDKSTNYGPEPPAEPKKPTHYGPEPQKEQTNPGISATTAPDMPTLNAKRPRPRAANKAEKPRITAQSPQNDRTT